MTSLEHPTAAETLDKVRESVEQYVDVGALREIAGEASRLPEAHDEVKEPPIGNVLLTNTLLCKYALPIFKILIKIKNLTYGVASNWPKNALGRNLTQVLQ